MVPLYLAGDILSRFFFSRFHTFFLNYVIHIGYSPSLPVLSFSFLFYLVLNFLRNSLNDEYNLSIFFDQRLSTKAEKQKKIARKYRSSLPSVAK